MAQQASTSWRPTSATATCSRRSTPAARPSAASSPATSSSVTTPRPATASSPDSRSCRPGPPPAPTASELAAAMTVSLRCSQRPHRRPPRLAGAPAVRAEGSPARRRARRRGRVLLRRVGTEPLVRVMVEARDGDQAQRIADGWRESCASVSRCRRDHDHEGDAMPLTGEYAPSTSAWAPKQAEAFEACDGAEADELQGKPIIVLTSVGRQERQAAQERVDARRARWRVAVVASKGGAPEHPDSYHDLVTNPRVELQDGAVELDYLAREVTGDEKASGGRAPPRCGRSTTGTRRRPTARSRCSCWSRWSRSSGSARSTRCDRRPSAG